MAGYLDTTRPSSTPPVDWQSLSRKDKAGVVCIMFLFLVVMPACIAGLTVYFAPDARYSVAIDSASGPDPRTGVSFNLTLGVASRSHGAKACIDPGTYVEVSYRGVQVAASDPVAEARRTCARPRDVAAMALVAARATMLPVGDVQDSLAAEI